MDVRLHLIMAVPQGSRWLSRVLRGAQDRDLAPGDDPLAYVHSLYGLALKLTRNQAAAEDLVQDTYLKVARFASRRRQDTNLKAWLFTVLRNTFLNDRRSASRHPVDVDSDLVESLPIADADADPERRLLRAAQDADVHAAFEALPAIFREVVWLRDVEDCSYKEIAEILGVPIGTVMSRLSRGRRLLFERLTAPQPAVAETTIIAPARPESPGLAGASAEPASS
jgi:RNA polymerase sigma-70 factor (ECF subfamily)